MTSLAALQGLREAADVEGLGRTDSGAHGDPGWPCRSLSLLMGAESGSAGDCWEMAWETLFLNQFETLISKGLSIADLH